MEHIPIEADQIDQIEHEKHRELLRQKAAAPHAHDGAGWFERLLRAAGGPDTADHQHEREREHEEHEEQASGAQLMRDSIDLVEKMLQFDPAKRITVHQYVFC